MEGATPLPAPWTVQKCLTSQIEVNGGKPAHCQKLAEELEVLPSRGGLPHRWGPAWHSLDLGACLGTRRGDLEESGRVGGGRQLQSSHRSADVDGRTILLLA